MGHQPHRFQYSLDWRFLLPLADTKNIFLLLDEDQDFNQALEQVGIQTSRRLSFSDLKQITNNEIQSLVMPFGIPAGWVTAKPEEQLEFYAFLRHLVTSGGYLLVGYNNIWNEHSRSQKKYHPSTPRRIVDQLKRVGFQSALTYGAMPNLAIPEYIFELDSRTIQFTLRNRFRRKPAVLGTLRILSAMVGWRRMSNFLPCYFTVATA